MTSAEDTAGLLRTLAAHPVLPPADALPPNDDAFRAVLADLASGNGSSRADTLRAVSAELRVSVDELSRRAQFLLTCLLLPTSGTHYEVLGVPPDATRQRIRKRWAALMQRYHPDHLRGATPGGGWLDAQARRLIEAYDVLKDPARRKAYDARLADELAGRTELLTDSSRERTSRFSGPRRWKWAPVGIAAVGIVTGVWAYTRDAREPFPHAPLPAAPRLLDRWAIVDAGTSAPTAPVPEPGRAVAAAPRHDEPGSTRSALPAELPSLKDRLTVIPPAAPTSSSATESVVASPSPILPAPVATQLPATSVAPAPAPPQVPAASVAPAPAPPQPPAAVLASKREVPAVVAAPALSQPAPAPARPVEPSPKPAPPPPAARPPVSALPSAVSQDSVVPGPPPPAVAAVKPTAAVPAEDPPARAETLALIEKFRVAYERKDLTTMMSLFGTEARDRDVGGRQAVEQLYISNFAVLDGIRYDLAKLAPRPPAGNGDLVVEGRFRIRATLGAPKPRPMDVVGPIRWLLRREDGVLRIVAVEYEMSAR